MDTVQLLCEISVLKQKMDKAEAFLEELVKYLLVTCKDDDYITPEVICRKLAKYGYIELENGYWVNPLTNRKIEPQTMPIKKAMVGTHRERIEYTEAEMVVEDEPQTEREGER